MYSPVCSEATFGIRLVHKGPFATVCWSSLLVRKRAQKEQTSRRTRTWTPLARTRPNHMPEIIYSPRGRLTFFFISQSRVSRGRFTSRCHLPWNSEVGHILSRGVTLGTVHLTEAAWLLGQRLGRVLGTIGWLHDPTKYSQPARKSKATTSKLLSCLFSPTQPLAPHHSSDDKIRQSMP